MGVCLTRLCFECAPLCLVAVFEFLARTLGHRAELGELPDKEIPLFFRGVGFLFSAGQRRVRGVYLD